LENSDDARGCPLTFILSPEGRGKGEGKGVSGVQPLNILKKQVRDYEPGKY